MIEAKREKFTLLKFYLNLKPEWLSCGAMDGSVILDVFGEKGFKMIMSKVPEEAKNFPDNNRTMEGWDPYHYLTPMPIMKAVIEKMIKDGKIVIIS